MATLDNATVTQRPIEDGPDGKECTEYTIHLAKGYVMEEHHSYTFGTPRMAAGRYEVEVSLVFDVAPFSGDGFTVRFTPIATAALRRSNKTKEFWPNDVDGIQIVNVTGGRLVPTTVALAQDLQEPFTVDFTFMIVQVQGVGSTNSSLHGQLYFNNGGTIRLTRLSD